MDYFRGHRDRAGTGNWEGDMAREIWGWVGMLRPPTRRTRVQAGLEVKRVGQGIL